MPPLISLLTKRHATHPSSSATRWVTLDDGGRLTIAHRGWRSRWRACARVLAVTRRDDVTFDVVVAAARSRVTLIATSKQEADEWVAALEAAATARPPCETPASPPAPPSPNPRRRSSLSPSPPSPVAPDGWEPRFGLVLVKLGGQSDRRVVAVPLALPPQRAPPLVAVGDGGGGGGGLAPLILLALARHGATIELSTTSLPVTHLPPFPLLAAAPPRPNHMHRGWWAELPGGDGGRRRGGVGGAADRSWWRAARRASAQPRDLRRGWPCARSRVDG